MVLQHSSVGRSHFGTLHRPYTDPTLGLCYAVIPSFISCFTYRIASNYGQSRINSWFRLVTRGIKQHNKNKCWISNKHLVQSLFYRIPGSVTNDEVKNVYRVPLSLNL